MLTNTYQKRCLGSLDGTSSFACLDIKGQKSNRYKRLNLFLVKPSKYDDDGYVIRHWKGVLPSNTLACLYGLSKDVQNREALGADLRWHIEAMDETTEKVNIRKFVRLGKSRSTKTVVCLVGVQSNQFPRARDLALDFRKAGFGVMIGGFHVSGVVATLSELPPELSALQDAGVTLVAGEVEGRWEQILQDALNDTLKPIYNFLNDPPDLSKAPMPEIPANLLNRYAVRHFATLDCGRGCPFRCTFCTVINVQGHRMRFRSVESIIEMIRKNYYQHKISYYFFTDDNFSRNKNWEALFDALTRLREEEKLKLVFMIQVDTQSHRIPNFVAKASRAGCSQVFIGMESINEENLKAVGKKQNQISDFKNLIETYHQAGIVTHVAYIIGFPFDSEATVRRDIAHLQSDLGAEQASFFMMTPLPGSVDYRNTLLQGVAIDADLNDFDCFHTTFRHPRMKTVGWKQVYEDAWKNFYSVENMKKILKNVASKKYWGVFLNFIWYKNAIQVEGGHPMLHGFFRRKGRHNRSKNYPLESRWDYFKRRVHDFRWMLTGWIKLAFEMEEVWLATRHRSPLEERVLLELSQFQKRAAEWQNLRLSELQDLYRKAASTLQASSSRISASHIRIPSRFQLWIKKWNVFSDSLTFSRFPMRRFWREVRKCLQQGRIHQIRFREMVLILARESILLARFFLSLSKQIGSSRGKYEVG